MQSLKLSKQGIDIWMVKKKKILSDVVLNDNKTKKFITKLSNHK